VPLYRIVLTASILAVVAPRAAAADPDAWKASFPAAVVATYHPDLIDGIVVVGAGDRGAALDDATAAVLDAYRVGGRARLVMDSRGLGDVGTLADGDIVKQAAHLPVSYVAIVRVYPGSRASAVVTVYDKAAAAVVSYVAAEGAPLLPDKAKAPAPVPAPIAPPPAAPPAAVPAVDPALGQARFDREFVWYPDFLDPAGAGGAAAYQGLQRDALEGERFYRAVDRPDLAGDYATRATTKLVVRIAGFAAIPIGLYVRSTSACEIDFNMPPMTTDEVLSCADAQETRNNIGLGLIVVGGLAAGLTWAFDTDPVGVHVRRELAREHNERLRRQLGLDPGYLPHAPARPSLTVTLTPIAAPGGGGLALTGRF